MLLHSSPVLTISEMDLPCKIFSYSLTLRHDLLQATRRLRQFKVSIRLAPIKIGKTTLYLPDSKKFRKIALITRANGKRSSGWMEKDLLRAYGI